MDWTPKSPADARLYSYDLSEIYPDTISTAVFAVTSGTVTLEEVPPDLRAAYVIVSGGAASETAVLSLTVVTALEQEITRSINLRIATDADALDPASSITKGSIVIRALGKLGIANYVFDTEAEEDNSALRQLDSLAARWQGKLEPFGYVQPATNGTSIPSDSAGIREEDVDTFISNLALALAPDYGKSPAPGLAKQAAESRSEFFCKYARRFEYQLPNRLPTGAGNDRFLGRRFFPSCR
jgi:hypothetical protein